MSLFTTRAFAISCVEFVGACGIALSSIEWLMNARHLRDEGLLSWTISQLRHRTLAHGALSHLLNPLFRYPGILWLHSIRLGAAVLLVSGILAGPVRALFTLVVALTTVAISLRSPFGLDGSDQMAGFIFCTLALARAFPGPVAEIAFLWVVALQSSLAYFTAGFAKLVSPIWRTGVAIPGISSTRMYGSRSASRFLHGRPWLSVGLAWSVILTECLFPLVLVVPAPVALSLLAAGMLFHVTSGLVMGLNSFIWSFAATYPAIWWCNTEFHSQHLL